MSEHKNLVGNYFARDCGAINAYALESPDGWFRCAQFTLLSIRQWFGLLPVNMAKVDAEGVTSRHLFGAKRVGWSHASANRVRFHGYALDYKAGRIDLNGLILRYLEIPSLGIIKAAFLAQLTVGNGACLDMHNLESLGLNPDSFKCPKGLKVPTIQAKIATYIAACDAQGDSAYWWDSWCHHLEERSGARMGKSLGWIATRLGDGDKVSALHRTIICGVDS